MVSTLNISLTKEQKAWIRARQQEGGFGSASDVVRDLIRQQRERELKALQEEFEQMDKRDGSDAPAPIEDIVKMTRKVRTRLLKNYGPPRRA